MIKKKRKKEPEWGGNNSGPASVLRPDRGYRHTPLWFSNYLERKIVRACKRRVTRLGLLNTPYLCDTLVFRTTLNRIL